MTHDDEFDPKLGKVRSRGSAQGRRYLQRVLQATALAGGRSRNAPAGRGKSHGNCVGRGAGVGRVLAARDRYSAFRIRCVVIKARIVKLGGKRMMAAQLHLRYIRREGVTRGGLAGELYDAKSDHADGPSFLERSKGDRHQFRFIVSAEDAAEYEDLKGFTRRLMTQVEEDLDTRLDWVAVDHFNTGHPHTHIVLRGKDERDRDLVIARDYIAQGMRERAAEIVTLDLGPRSDLEIENRLRQEVEQERFTSLDRNLLRDAEGEGLVAAAASADDSLRQTLRAGRLQKLRRLGLADEIAPGRWRLDAELEPTLRRMGEREDIIKTLHHAMTRGGAERAVSDYAIYDPSDPNVRRLVGRVASRGISEENEKRHYVVVDGVDGRAHYVEIGRADATEALPEGAIVSVEPKRAEPKDVDRTVAEIAASNGGRYDIEIHLRHDSTATVDFAETHVRRLEAMRRLGSAVERSSDGTWLIASDHLERAVAFERMQARVSPVTVETLSALPLERQVAAEGATWLDRELLASAPIPVRDAGFGREAREALVRRQQWLVEQELARLEHDRIVYRANMLGLLRRRELTGVAAQLSDELGLHYAEAQAGERIEGVYRRRLDLASGRFAVIAKSREFTLVPWRLVLERNLGKPVSGIAREEGISWKIGRQRGLGVS